MPLTLLLTPSVLPSASGRVLLAFGCPTVSVLPSTQLLDRSALRPVDGFHHPPWMVVTPSTTMASADFCPPERGRPPRIRCDSFPPSPAAFTWSRFGPFRASLSVASLPRAPRLLTRFLSIRSGFCPPASSPHTLASMQLPLASGSSDQRPLETFTP